MSLEIPLNDKYRLTSDTHNLILEKFFPPTEKKNKPGEFTQGRWEQIAFFSQVKHVLEFLAEKGIRESESLAEVAVRQREIHSMIHSLPEFPVPRKP